MSNIEPWRAGLTVIAGLVYEHGGICYRVKFSHVAMDGYPPDKCPDLYDPIRD